MLTFIEKMKTKRNEGGFTLIELLIVIIILAILAAIVVFAVGTTTKNAVASSCNADAKSVETALEASHAQTGTFTTSLGNLATTLYFSSGSYVTTANANTSVGPWLRTVPQQNHYIVYLGGGASGGTTGGVYVLAPTNLTTSFPTYTSFTQAFDATAGTTQSNDNFDSNTSICGSYS